MISCEYPSTRSEEFMSTRVLISVLVPIPSIYLSNKSRQNLTFKQILTLSHLQTHFTQYKQVTFENIVAKGKIAHDEQFLLWPQCFQLYLEIKLSFMEIFLFFATIFSKSSVADLFYVGKC